MNDSMSKQRIEQHETTRRKSSRCYCCCCWCHKWWPWISDAEQATNDTGIENDTTTTDYYTAVVEDGINKTSKGEKQKTNKKIDRRRRKKRKKYIQRMVKQKEKEMYLQYRM
mmetsp:Transcript_38320/g.38674  ORF Transcript_38320/g.38674 Transcript_38320/m.38674 type:complete len:112 (+) Transcript_38320:7-342(+)